MNPSNDQKALVTVIDDLATAEQAILKLRESGYPQKQIELVSHHVVDEAPEVDTPDVHETTQSSVIDNASKWASMGAGGGAIAGLMTGFPGMALGMAIMGGVTGAIMGGIAGVEHTVEDESVNLPSIEEYEQLVKDGNFLIVLLGTLEEIKKGEEVIKHLPHMQMHLHPVQGHDFHIHPTHGEHQ